MITGTILFIAGMCTGFMIAGLMCSASDADDQSERIYREEMQKKYLQTREEYYGNKRVL